MWTRIDHVMITVPDLQKGIDQYRRIGFNVQPGGAHPGKGTHNALALNQEDYLELIAIRDVAEYRGARASGWPGLEEHVQAGGGIRFVVIQSDDLAADVAAMRKRGVEVSDATEGSRNTPGGQVIRWKAAFLGPKNPLPIFFIQQMMPMAERRQSTARQKAEVGSQTQAASAPITHHPSPITEFHPNGVYSIERAYIVYEDVRAAAADYAKVLGIPAPEPHRGTVIMADMSVFQIGPNGLGIVSPHAPGPAAEALERRGPGPFQALYRTNSMDAAAKWMQAQGLPPLARGTRNTGEQAMLVPPGEAFGAYIGFVGRA